MISIILFVVAVQVLMPLAMYFGRDRMIFLPSAEPGPEQGLRFLRGTADVELVYVKRPDGRRLAAYDVRPKAPMDDTAPVVLFLHGNAGNIAYRAPFIEDFVRGTATRTLLLDYSGYGGNAGNPSEQEAYADGLAAFEHLAAEIEPSRIVLYGESLGGAVALYVAGERPVAGVVTQSTFSSLSSLASRLYFWMPLGGILARGAFPSAERVARLQAPLLIVHGTRDEIIPFAEAESLHGAARPGTELMAIDGAGHNDLMQVAGQDYLRRLKERFEQWAEPVSP